MWDFVSYAFTDYPFFWTIWLKKTHLCLKIIKIIVNISLSSQFPTLYEIVNNQCKFSYPSFVNQPSIRLLTISASSTTFPLSIDHTVVVGLLEYSFKRSIKLLVSVFIVMAFLQNSRRFACPDFMSRPLKRYAILSEIKSRNITWQLRGISTSKKRRHRKLL